MFLNHVSTYNFTIHGMDIIGFAILVDNDKKIMFLL
jgi:hypothetical protein